MPETQWSPPKYRAVPVSLLKEVLDILEAAIEDDAGLEESYSSLYNEIVGILDDGTPTWENRS